MVDKKKSKVLISFKCFKITLRDTNMCVGTYLGSLVLSQTLSYSYQNRFFKRQNWLFTLAIKLILKKQEKNMPLYWHFFNFIFIELFAFLVSNEICNTFQSIQVGKKNHKNCQNLGFSSILFLARMNLFTCENNVRLYKIWNYCARLCQIVSYWTQLDPIWPN